MKRWVVIAGSLLVAACSAVGYSPGIDHTQYEVVRPDQSEVKIRSYDPMIMVVTDMPGGMDSGRPTAYRRLIDYVSGENSKGRALKMASSVYMEGKELGHGDKVDQIVPVFMWPEGGRYYMGFVLPAKYTIATAPKPIEKTVWLGEVGAHDAAVLRFNGITGGAQIESQARNLEDWIAGSGYQAAGGYKAALYDPPFSVPALRRNEVMIPVKSR